MRTQRLALVAALGVLAASCVPGELSGGDTSSDGRGKADSSAVATFLSFELEGELLASAGADPVEQIREQLFYTVGPLNQLDSVGRLDKLVASEVKATEAEGGKARISYRAVLPVAWGQRDRVPEQHTFVLPRDVSYGGIAAFFEKYKDSCSAPGAHDMDASVFWYDYRSDRPGCQPDEQDVVRVTARVRPNPLEVTGRFPEYHKVWEDDTLRVISIYGLDKAENAGSESDLGVRSYRLFVEQMLELLAPYAPETEPALPSKWAETPQLTIRASLGGGKRIEVTAFLVSRMTSTTAAFDQAYNKLSGSADLIAYNGHSGVGANIRALARKGSWVRGQYAIVFMNGCDTFAYQDSALADAHKAVNPDETTGTKYVDLVLNAMPAGWNFYRDDATTVLVKGLLRHDAPRTFERMLLDFPSDQVALVAGDEDNVFVPGYPGDSTAADDAWQGLDERAVLASGEELRRETPKLAPGRYELRLSGGGDADLYLRVGTPASTEIWDCRPARFGSAETCRVDLPTAAPLHVLVRGKAESSPVELSARRLR